MNEWTWASSTTQAGTTKALTEQPETIAELELDTHFLGMSQHFSKETLDWPHTFLDDGFVFYAHLQATSSLLVWKTRLLYSLAALWSHKANCTAPGSLTWDVYSTQTCPQELPPAPCLYNSKITPWDWWRNCYIFGNRWVQSGCFSNIPEILHELFGGKLVL